MKKTYYSIQYRSDVKSERFTPIYWASEEESEEDSKKKAEKILVRYLTKRGSSDHYRVVKTTEEVVPFEFGVKIGDSE